VAQDRGRFRALESGRRRSKREVVVVSAVRATVTTSAWRGHALGRAGKPRIMDVASIRASVPNGSGMGGREAR
jgi:hypothetical protein